MMLPAASPAAAQSPLLYYGGEIAHDPHVYLTFWGKNWNQQSGARTEIRELFAYLSGSDYQGILTQYYDNVGHISNQVGFNYWTDESISAPNDVSWPHIEQEIFYAMAQQGWPGAGINNLYIVLPAPGSQYQSGFVLGCGAHYYGATLNAPMAYVGWPGEEPFTGCSLADPSGQNRAWVGAMMTAAHEYAESATDPLTPKFAGKNTGWLDEAGKEVADKCNSLGGALVGGHYAVYLWDNAQNQCSLSHPVVDDPPTAVTAAVSNLTETQATFNGTVNPNGTQTSYRFEYGKTTNYGSSVPVPDGSAGAGTSAVGAANTVTLLPRTRYHYRIVATNQFGSSYGSDQAFTTGLKWNVRNSNKGGNADASFWFGLPGEKRVHGDWNGDGVPTPGVYNPTTGLWKLRNSNSTGPADISFQYGGGDWETGVVGDWDGNGTTTIGVYDQGPGNWNLRNSNSAGGPFYSFQYGGGAWETGVAGDWNGDGTTTIGVYDKEPGNWNLRNSNSAGFPSYSFQYGGGAWETGGTGDWDGNGTTTIGVYDQEPGNWNLRNSNSAGNPSYSFQYGGSQFKPVVGDWDNNGTETAGQADPNAETAIEWQLRNSNSAGSADLLFEGGSPGEEQITGDWDGNGTVTIGRYKPSTGVWKLSNSNAAGATPIEFQYGGSQFKPVTGDWDGNGTTTIGLFEPIEGRWELRNANSAGKADLDFKYGGSQFKPVTGDWDGNGTTTVGLYYGFSGDWQLKNSNSAGEADLVFEFEPSIIFNLGKAPVTGDWDGNGSTTIGLFEPQEGRWELRNANSAGKADLDFKYGGSQFKSATGDWDGNGTDTIGLVTW